MRDRSAAEWKDFAQGFSSWVRGEQKARPALKVYLNADAIEMVKRKIDTDNDGIISVYELSNAFAVWHGPWRPIVRAGHNYFSKQA